MSIQKKLRKIEGRLKSFYPDLPFFKRAVAKAHINRFHGFLISQEEIQAGENDPGRKQSIVDKNLEKHQFELSLTQRTAERLFQEAPAYVGRRDLDELRTDILFCRLAYGFQPDEYLCFELEDKTPQERKTFISDIERLCFVYRMNDVKDMRTLNDKYKTYQMLRPYYQRDAVCVSSEADYAAYQAYIKTHPAFVKKSVLASMGRTIELVDLNSCGKTEREVFDELLSQHKKFILEERVVQSQALSALHESSVNTIRCITLLTRNGPEVAYCFMKIGRDGSFVDNGGAGGILVGIDKQTGQLDTDGFDELNNRYVSHPNTWIRFQGYQLPEWNQMLDICREIAAKMPSLRYIGWDMAHTDNGWGVTVGNGMSQLIGPQIVWKRGIQAEIEAYLSNTDTIV